MLGVPTKTRLESRIKKFTPQCICRPGPQIKLLHTYSEIGTESSTDGPAGDPQPHGDSNYVTRQASALVPQKVRHLLGGAVPRGFWPPFPFLLGNFHFLGSHNFLLDIFGSRVCSSIQIPWPRSNAVQTDGVVSNNVEQVSSSVYDTNTLPL